MYKINKSLGIENGVVRLSDKAFIPFDPANTDAQQFAKWLAEGNTPLEAETPADTP